MWELKAEVGGCIADVRVVGEGGGCMADVGVLPNGSCIPKDYLHYFCEQLVLIERHVLALAGSRRTRKKAGKSIPMSSRQG